MVCKHQNLWKCRIELYGKDGMDLMRMIPAHAGPLDSWWFSQGRSQRGCGRGHWPEGRRVERPGFRKGPSQGPALSESSRETTAWTHPTDKRIINKHILMKKGNRQIRTFSIVMEHKLHQLNKKIYNKNVFSVKYLKYLVTLKYTK